MKTLIFDRNIGMLQHVSALEDEAAALAEFDADVGIDPNGTGLATCDWKFYRVSDDMADKVMDWQARGAPASEFPL
jgi:hypothetical protein